MEPQMELKKDEEYKIRNQTPAEKEENDNGENIPQYEIKLKLSEEEQQTLAEQVFLEYEAIVDERKDLNLTNKWEERDRQYDGEMQNNKTLAFNLHVHQSKIKTDAIVQAINEAFLDSEPMFDISPRPDAARKDGFEVAEKQAQFLDFAVDEEIKPENALVRIAKSTITKFVGIGKLSWKYKRERRRREESYEGEWVPSGVQNGQFIKENEGLKKFLSVYPDAMEKQRGIVKRLVEEKKVEIVVEFKDTIDNNPELEYIKVENFFVKNSVDYQKGLRDTHFIGELQEYSYWDLLKKEENGEFENVEKLWNTDTDEENHAKDYMTKDYKVLEATTYMRIKEDDKEEIKIKAWFGAEDEGKKIFLGAEIYPYYGFDTDYLAFYVKLNDDGFYGGCKSVMYDLKDSNIAQDVLLNLAIHGTYIRNLLTPIVKEGSEIEEMFLDHQFEAGKPLVVDPLTDDVSKAMSFVQWGNIDLNGSLILMEKMKRIDGDVSKVSDLTTGAESELDPSAPASKTIALLQQSGIGIKNYIRIFLPTYNIMAGRFLQLYYQMSQEDKQYKVLGKSKAVTGDNPFSSISREEMMVKTNIQSRAAAFVFDKVNEKREAMAAYQVTRDDPYASQQPNLLYKSLKVLLETFGPRWKAIVDTDLLSPEDFQQKMNQTALKAVQQLFLGAQQKAENTGVDMDPNQVLNAAPGAIQQAQAEDYNPQLRVEREKAEAKNK
ncbi:MAG: hypothetical protein U9O94_01505 [Nanoarchaeota archaeon]|nr:hypothetical protein [Nanoarchaeota archaeon]